jgi:hypothetical protein
MALNSLPSVEAGTSNNNRIYRATQSGTYDVDVKPGVYRVTRQATTNIILGGQTIVPSTMSSLLFLNTAETSITFNSTVSQNQTPWVNTGSYSNGIEPGYMIYDDILGFYILNHRSNIERTAVSTDAVNWVRRDIAGIGMNYFNAWYQMRRVRPDRIMAPGGFSQLAGSIPIVHTTDGRNWGRFEPAGQVNQVNWNNGQTISVDNPTSTSSRIVIGGYASNTTGTLISSNDPFNTATWTRYALLSSEDFVTSTYGAGRFVFCGGSGSLRTSTDGTTWAAGNPGFGMQRINEVIFAQNQFVAVGNTGIITRSTDGITWNTSTSGFATNVGITNIVYSPDEDLFTAFARGNQLARISTDAVTWVERTIPTTFENNALTYAEGKYTYLRRLDTNTFATYQVSSMLTTSPTVPFTDTYIMLDFQGQISTLT